MKDESVLIQYVGNAPKLRVIDFFIDNLPFDYSKKEIIEGSGISKTTFFKIWKDFIKFDILKSTRKYGKAQLYTLNKEHIFVKQLLALEFALANEYAERLSKSKAVPTKHKR